MNRRDVEYKEKIKQNARNKNTKEHNFITGNQILLKRKKTNKRSTAFQPAFYIVTQVDGLSIAARRIVGECFAKQVSVSLPGCTDRKWPDQEVADQGGESDCGDWRQEFFRNAETHSSPKETTAREEQVVEIEGSSSEKSEPTKALENRAKPKHKRQRPCYLEDHLVWKGHWKLL